MHALCMQSCMHPQGILINQCYNNSEAEEATKILRGPKNITREYLYGDLSSYGVIVKVGGVIPCSAPMFSGPEYKTLFTVNDKNQQTSQL